MTSHPVILVLPWNVLEWIGNHAIGSLMRRLHRNGRLFSILTKLQKLQSFEITTVVVVWKMVVFRVRNLRNMHGHTCVVCGNSSRKDPGVSLHCSPGQNDPRAKEPLQTLGKTFASPKKQNHPGAKRAKVQEVNKMLETLRDSITPPVRSKTPVGTPASPLTSPVGEWLETNYDVYGLLSEVEKSGCPSSLCQSSSSTSSAHHGSSNTWVNSALLARIETLKAENKCLKASGDAPQAFRIEQIQDDDIPVRFYTGFV